MICLYNLSGEVMSGELLWLRHDHFLVSRQGYPDGWQQHVDTIVEIIPDPEADKKALKKAFAKHKATILPMPFPVCSHPLAAMQEVTRDQVAQGFEHRNNQTPNYVISSFCMKCKASWSWNRHTSKLELDE